MGRNAKVLYSHTINNIIEMVWLNDTPGDRRTKEGDQQIPKWVRENQQDVLKALDNRAGKEGYKDWDDYVKKNPLFTTADLVDESRNAFEENSRVRFLNRVSQKNEELVFDVTDMTKNTFFDSKLKFHTKKISRLGERNEKLRKILVSHYSEAQVNSVEEKAFEEFGKRLDEGRLIETTADLEPIARSRIGRRLGWIAEARRGGFTDKEIHNVRKKLSEEEMQRRYGFDWRKDLISGKISRWQAYSTKADRGIVDEWFKS